MNKDESMLFMEKLLRKHNLTQSILAKDLGTSRQYINSLIKGRRVITHEYMVKITNLYPMDEYRDDGNYIKIPYYENHKEKLYMDKKLLTRKRCFDVNIDSCAVINIITDSMSPEYSLGDKAIIDTSIKHFIDSQIFVFTIGGETYIRRVNIMPNQIKCIATNNSYDTFYLSQADVYNILGVLVPKIRL